MSLLAYVPFISAVWTLAGLATVALLNIAKYLVATHGQ